VSAVIARATPVWGRDSPRGLILGSAAEVVMPRFLHFSTKADYERLAASDELFSNPHFVPDISYRENAYTCLKGLSSLPDLGVIRAKIPEAGPNWYVFPEPPKLRLRPTPPINGQKWYDLAGGFKVSLWFQPRGLFRKKNLICGFLEVTNPIGDTVRLFRQIAKAFERVYAKGKYFGDVTYAGPDAIERQKKGLRLTDSPNLGPELDFDPKTMLS
jgi:hypothetical protein